MNTSFRTYLLFFLAAVIAAVTVYGAVSVKHTKAIQTIQPSESFANDFDVFQAYNPPQSLPPIELFSLDGKVMKLDDFKGKWRLVNFWATWCPSCIEELPHLLELKKLKGGKTFDVVFISLDYMENIPSFKESMKRAKISPALHTFYVKDLNVWETLSIESIPTSIIIDPKGRIHFKLLGEPDWTGKESLAFIDDLLNN